MDKILEQSLLFDFYGELLNDNQRSIYDMYVFNNLSFAEIAESLGISRQGVYDTYKRSITLLEHYEAVLHMVSQYRYIGEQLDNISSLVDDLKNTEDINLLYSIDSIINKIKESL